MELSSWYDFLCINQVISNIQFCCNASNIGFMLSINFQFKGIRISKKVYSRRYRMVMVRYLMIVCYIVRVAHSVAVSINVVRMLHIVAVSVNLMRMSHTMLM